VLSDTYSMPQHTGSMTPADSNGMTIWGESKLRPKLPSVSIYKHIAALSQNLLEKHESVIRPVSFR
jgi:hypothetical protein